MSYSDPARILVTTSRGNSAEEYLDALREAGAEPVLVQAGGERPSLSDVDGLLVTGGVDVDPAVYGAEASGLAGRVERERDELESVLLWDARERRLPTFCICRGLQIANVAFGGTLFTDVPTALGHDAKIRHAVRNAAGRSERGVIPEHVVRIEPGSLLARTVRTLNLPTGARHHQAPQTCADDLLVVGRTDDGIIEALEANFDSPFWLAVQWHPESTRALDDGASLKLFRAFVSAARSERRGGAPQGDNGIRRWPSGSRH
ncbi:MAG: glutamine amidotransferase [Candidatus Eremiobacteraeota bacterium]|nr:glutamine amidotransferase [Candidatus Eremiobacteraeota bacterium]